MHALQIRLPDTPPRTVARRLTWTVLPRVVMMATLSGALLGSLGCSSSSVPTAPRGAAIVTVRVIDEQFRMLLTTPAQIEAARAAQAGGPASIPNGRLVAGTQVNTGYSWHVVDVEFAEATVEVCDGLPSHVQRQGVQFGAGRYCPWSARIVGIEVTP